MKKLILILLFIPLVSFGQFNMQLFPNYNKSENLDKYQLLFATYEENETMNSSIEVKFSDDWSFKILDNKELINQLIENKDFESYLKSLYEDLNIMRKGVVYIKNLGDCFQLVYSGNYKTGNIILFNTVTQFIKNDKLYTISTSSHPESFSRNYQDYLKMFDTMTF